MRSEKNGLRAQTTTSPRSCEVRNTRVPRHRGKHRPASAAAVAAPVCVSAAFQSITMGAKAGSRLLAAVPLWMCFGRAAALSEPQICYVLDGILFLYGIILTALYCRIKIYNSREDSGGKGKSKQNVEEGIYTGLTPHKQDTYETIGMKK
ncbi:high affinity immunoglobulin epsilon receptor subunit gamma [Poeciliopsis prolifica]|uniref:high affinity immunoglobulin epsilon receptor subunit gamma n=1 Tax=Poeciliopsis prolifica TaxID=188132 RepID=UPI002414143E|nr:high affinity immunoglobulin epsilon receptor subunit gamma [Poeciliopsis prolifica]